MVGCILGRLRYVGPAVSAALWQTCVSLRHDPFECGLPLLPLQKSDGSAREGEEEWAHMVMKPEKGCVLLSHPLMFKDQQQYFQQAVIFIIEHMDTEVSRGPLPGNGVSCDVLVPKLSVVLHHAIV